jgi:hypothetical protein
MKTVKDEDEGLRDLTKRFFKQLYITLPGGLTVLWGFGAVVHHFL